VYNSVGSLTVTPTVIDPTATIKVNGTTVSSGAVSGNISLHTGTNNIHVVATAQDGVSTSSYLIAVTRLSSSDASLGNLTVSTGTLVPVFDYNTTQYINTVSYSARTITVTPTASQPGSVIVVNGTRVTSGSPSNPISLKVGINTATIVVTAPDAVTINTYVIDINRSDPVASSTSTISVIVDGLDTRSNYVIEGWFIGHSSI
jgi:hypothetical protein